MKYFLPRRCLTFSEISLIPESFFYLAVAWIKVSFSPSKKYLSQDNPLNSEPVTLVKTEKALEIAAVINGVSSRSNWTSTCLIKALAAHNMLEKRKIKHKLHFGVARSLEKKLKAHAWLSIGSEVIVGGENHEGFMELKENN